MSDGMRHSSFFFPFFTPTFFAPIIRLKERNAKAALLPPHIFHVSGGFKRLKNSGASKGVFQICWREISGQCRDLFPYFPRQ